jgi:hypothetical protein
MWLQIGILELRKLPKRKPSLLGRFSFCMKRALFLRLFENDALAQGRIELDEFDLALHGLLILAAPDDVRRLRGLELDKANL